MNKNKNDKNEYSSYSPSGVPGSVTEMLGKYGTYEVQDTADTENEFPAIAQGLPRSKKKKSIDKNQLKKYGVENAD